MLRTFHARSLRMLQHQSAPFKVAELSRWIVVVGTPKHVEELRRAPDDTLSPMEATSDVGNYFLPVRLNRTERHQQTLQVKYTMGPEICYNPYHVQVVRSRLTRNIGVLYPELRSEMRMAFDDVLDLKDNGKYLVLIYVCYSSMPGITRMEEYAGAQQCAKGDLQND